MQGVRKERMPKVFRRGPKGGAESPALLKVLETLLPTKKVTIRNPKKGKGGIQSDVCGMEQVVEGLALIIKL